MRPPSSRPVASARFRAGLVLLALGALLVVALVPFAMGLLGVGVLYVLSAPAHRRLARRVGAHPAAAIVLTAAVILVLLPGVLLTAMLVEQAPDTLRAFQQQALLSKLSTLRVGALDVGALLARVGQDATAWLSAQVLQLFGSATRATLNLVIAFFGLYYMLLSADDAWSRVRRYVPFSAEGTEALRARFYSLTEATLLGTAATAITQGAIVGIGFALARLPEPLFWGVVTACVSVLPVLGSALVWLPGAAVLALQGRYGAAIGLALLGGLVASNVDNVIRPLINQRVSHVHPMITLVGAFAGVAYVGLPGLLLGPLAIAYFFELVHLYEAEYGSHASDGGPVTAPAGALAPPVAAADVERV
jgi:predicted PurR-regulated permease PerM